MIVGLCSTYKEGLLAADAVRSLLACCQSVFVLDGPIGEAREGGRDTDWRALQKRGRVVVKHGSWGSDAEKRTAMLRLTRRYVGPVWGVIVDGDEQLMYGEGIPALIEHHEAEAETRGETSAGATLRIVEGDGTVGLVLARVLRLDLIDRWLISSYHMLLTNGVEVSRPNAYILKPGEPDQQGADLSTGMQLRRPLIGEPHLLHRSWFRAPQRDAVRQSVAEGSDMDRMVREAGLLEVHGERARDDRPAIWLPQ